MQEIHIEEHRSPIQNWKQLLVVAVLGFAVPVFLIIAVVQIVTGGLHVDPASPAMSEEAVAARLKPVGRVALETGTAALTPTNAPAPAASSPAPAAKAKTGEQVYQEVCSLCHGAGIAGAPKTGDRAAWKPRLAQGQPTLYAHAIGGIRTMPARGGNANLSDAEVKAAVDYLAAKAK